MDEILMLTGVSGFCHDCGDLRILVAAEDDGFDYCCTDCDAAVLLLEVVHSGLDQQHRHVA